MRNQVDKIYFYKNVKRDSWKKCSQNHLPEVDWELNPAK